MGRRAPRSIASAIGQVRSGIEPPSQLAAIQGAWTELMGEAIAAVTRPVSMREAVLTINCSDAIWAEELSLMREDLLERLRGHLGTGAPTELKFRTGSL
jgi:predicted nucleic acid-binding Zn ribbon protein